MHYPQKTRYSKTPTPHIATPQRRRVVAHRFMTPAWWAAAALSLSSCGGDRFEAPQESELGAGPGGSAMSGESSSPASSPDSVKTEVLDAVGTLSDNEGSTNASAQGVKPADNADPAGQDGGATAGQEASSGELTAAATATPTSAASAPEAAGDERGEEDNNDVTQGHDPEVSPGADAGTASIQGDLPCDDCTSGIAGDIDAGDIDAEELVDDCPDWPEQTVRGACGCGFESDPTCAVLELALVHRYSFAGRGVSAIDSVGGAHASIMGTELTDDGELHLSGSGEYVDLPAGIISALNSATFEFWLEWHGGDAYQRVMDFGGLSNDSDDAAPQTYLYLTPSARTLSSSGKQPLTASYSLNGSSVSEYLRADKPLPRNKRLHLALVVDDENDEVRLYVEGKLVGDSWLSGWSLTQLNDEYNRLGRSLFGDDPDFNGTYDEFRIYDLALTRDQLAKSIELGPNATFSQ